MGKWERRRRQLLDDLEGKKSIMETDTACTRSHCVESWGRGCGLQLDRLSNEWMNEWMNEQMNKWMNECYTLCELIKKGNIAATWLSNCRCRCISRRYCSCILCCSSCAALRAASLSSSPPHSPSAPATSSCSACRASCSGTSRVFRCLPNLKHYIISKMQGMFWIKYNLITSTWNSRCTL